MSDILKQNAKAVRSALDDQNKKLDKFETTLKNLSKAYTMLQQEVTTLKMQSYQNMAKSFSGGSTSRGG